MDTQTRTEYNALTNTVEVIPLTDAEIADREALAAAQAEKEAQAETDKASATAKLKALGLTAEDLKALGL
jgi:hypothetical protein